MLKTIVVDDEKYVLKKIAATIKKCQDIYDGVEVVAEFTDAQEALNWLKENHQLIDVVFLDVEMPVFNGFMLADAILNFANNIFIVFITAHEQYAFKAFEVQALDFILKPITVERIKISLQRIYERKQILLREDLLLNTASSAKYDELWEKNKLREILHKEMPEKCSNKVLLYHRKQWMLLDKNIIYCFYKNKSDKYVKVLANDSVYETMESLSVFSNTMKNESFICCYRNVFINKNFIKKVERDTSNERGGIVSLHGCKEKFPVSRSYLNAVFSAFAESLTKK